MAYIRDVCVRETEHLQGKNSLATYVLPHNEAKDYILTTSNAAYRVVDSIILNMGISADEALD